MAHFPVYKEVLYDTIDTLRIRRLFLCSSSSRILNQPFAKTKPFHVFWDYLKIGTPPTFLGMYFESTRNSKSYMTLQISPRVRVRTPIAPKNMISLII